MKPATPVLLRYFRRVAPYLTLILLVIGVVSVVLFYAFAFATIPHPTVAVAVLVIGMGAIMFMPVLAAAVTAVVIEALLEAEAKRVEDGYRRLAAGLPQQGGNAGQGTEAAPADSKRPKSVARQRRT